MFVCVWQVCQYFNAVGKCIQFIFSHNSPCWKFWSISPSGSINAFTFAVISFHYITGRKIGKMPAKKLFKSVQKVSTFLQLIKQTKKCQMVRFWRKIFNFHHIIGIKNILFTNKTDKKIEFGPHLVYSKIIVTKRTKWQKSVHLYGKGNKNFVKIYKSCDQTRKISLIIK